MEENGSFLKLLKQPYIKGVLCVNPIKNRLLLAFVEQMAYPWRGTREIVISNLSRKIEEQRNDDTNT
jgi:hypothetical protein